jgi:ATP-dependent DNA helicase RecG
VIERYPDRFEFNNPGILLVSLEQFRKGGVSECRNKQLQKMFVMLGYGEQAGSGVERIRNGWREKHWRVPFIRVVNKPDRVILTLPMVSLIPTETLAQLKRSFGHVIDTLKPIELQALATAHLEGSVTNGRLQELVQDHRFDITKALQHLCELELLSSDNRRRWTTYRLPDTGGLHMPDKGTGQQPTQRPVALGVDRNGASDVMPDKGVDMPDKEGVIPDSQKLRTRVSPELTKARILELCQGTYLTPKELASQLGKNAHYISNNFIYPLVQEGRLRPKFPGSKRKDQAYTTAHP